MPRVFIPQVGRTYKKRYMRGIKTIYVRKRKLRKGYRHVPYNQLSKTDKFNDVNIDYDNATGSSWGLISESSVFTLLNGISEGTEENQHIADKVYNTYLSGRLSLNLTTGNGANNIRVVIFRQKFVFGTLPNKAQMFQALTNIFENYNPDYMGTQFSIIHDKVYPISDQRRNVIVKVKKRLGFTTSYGEDSNVVASIATNGLWMMVFGTVPQATNTFTVKGLLRLHYKD